MVICYKGSMKVVNIIKNPKEVNKSNTKYFEVFKNALFIDDILN